MKRSSPPSLKWLCLEEQIKCNETWTYLRLKVRRSSLALNRSLTENVALPRKQLWKQDRKEKVDIMLSPNSYDTKKNVMSMVVFGL